jgi:hypothetical protein
MKWHSLITWIPALTLLNGCYAMIEARQEVVSVHPTLLRGRTARVTIDVTRELTQRHEGGRLVIALTDVEHCREDLIEEFANVERTTRTLPTSFWWLAGGSVAAVGGGSALWGANADQFARDEAAPLGDASFELRRDKTLQSVNAGQYALSIGAVALISSIADLWLARDEAKELPTTSETTFGPIRECGRRPAQNTQVTLNLGGVTHTMRSNPDGLAIADLTSTDFEAAVLVEPLGSIKADGVASVAIGTDAGWLSGVIVSRSRRDELRAWLSRNSGSPLTSVVLGALAAENTRRADALATESEAATSRGDAAVGRAKAAECLNLLADHLPCVQALAGADHAKSETILLLGNERLSVRDFEGASQAAIECLGVISDFAPCLNLAQQATAAAEAEEKWLQDWGGSHRRRAVQTAKDAVSQRLRAPATAKWIALDVLGVFHNNYYVRVVVDSQNIFRVPIRTTACVVLQLDLESAKSYRTTGSVDCPEELTEEEMQSTLRAFAEEWPARKP